MTTTHHKMSPTQKYQRISHTRNPSLSFQSLHFPSDRQFPLYAHCNSQRYRSSPHLRCNTKSIPHPRQQNLMVRIYSWLSRRPTLSVVQQTVDYRYSRKTRRSSFALVRPCAICSPVCHMNPWHVSQSDIFELDEEEVEIEISPILPSAPNSACSTISSTRSAKSMMKTALIVSLSKPGAANSTYVTHRSLHIPSRRSGGALACLLSSQPIARSKSTCAHRSSIRSPYSSYVSIYLNVQYTPVP